MNQFKDQSTVTARRLRPLAVAAVLMAGGLLPGAAAATTIQDVGGDLLPTFLLNGDGLDHSDLDVLSAGATRDDLNVYLTATMAGDIGMTAEGIYVWGVDRGSGSDLLNSGPKPVGAGVKFDTFIVLRQDGSAVVNLIDMANGQVRSKGLEAGSVTIAGRTIRVVVPLSDLPTSGFGVASYGYNIWPRFRDTLVNEHVADFAPDNHNFTASVPEPASWALMIAGFGASGAMLRRRRPAVA